MPSNETQSMRKAVLTVATLIFLMGSGSLVLVANSAERLHGAQTGNDGYGVLQASAAESR